MILSAGNPVRKWPFGFLSLFVFFVAIHSYAGPRLQCSASVYDFGTLISQESITHEFVLKNVGDEPVRISNIKNCCGVTSSIDPMVIEPGSNAVCTSVFTAKNRHGKQEKQILIASNDRKNPYFELKMSGTLLKAITVTPRYLRLNSLSVGSKISQTITAVNQLKEPVTLDSVQSTVPGIVAKVTVHADSFPGHWTIQLRSNNQLQPGKLRGQIKLNFSTGPVTVPVLGLVKPAIQVTPDRIRLSASSDKEVERLIMLKSEQPFEVLSAVLDSIETPVQVVRIAENKWKLAVKVNPAGFSSQDLLVRTTCPGQPEIVIPISVR